MIVKNSVALIIKWLNGNTIYVAIRLASIREINPRHDFEMYYRIGIDDVLHINGWNLYLIDHLLINLNWKVNLSATLLKFKTVNVGNYLYPAVSVNLEKRVTSVDRPI